MAHFPLFIDIAGRKCLVIGGGKVAGRKVETLLKYGARVKVISPEVCPMIQDLVACRPDMDKDANQPCSVSKQAGLSICLTVPGQSMLEEEIKDAALVVAASGSRQTNHLVADISKKLHVPVNVADQPSECTFIFPAVVKKDEISVGISTGGLSPIVSSAVRREIQETIPDYYADIALQLGRLREGMKDRIPEEKDRRRFLKEVAAEAFRLKRVLTDEELAAL